MNGHVLDALPVDGDVAGAGVQQAHDDVERCGFTGTIRAQQTHNLASAHRQRDVFNDLASPIRLLQVVRL